VLPPRSTFGSILQGHGDRGFVALVVVLYLCRIVLESCDLDLELLIELSQLLLLQEDILVVESHLLSPEIRLCRCSFICSLSRRAYGGVGLRAAAMVRYGRYVLATMRSRCPQ